MYGAKKKEESPLPLSRAPASTIHDPGRSPFDRSTRSTNPARPPTSLRGINGLQLSRSSSLSPPPSPWGGLAPFFVSPFPAAAYFLPFPGLEFHSEFAGRFFGCSSLHGMLAPAEDMLPIRCKSGGGAVPALCVAEFEEEERSDNEA